MRIQTDRQNTTQLSSDQKGSPSYSKEADAEGTAGMTSKNTKSCSDLRADTTTDSLKKLVRKRGSVKGRLTRVRYRIIDELGHDNPSVRLLKQDLEKALNLMALIEEFSETIRSMLEDLETEESLNQLEELDRWENNYDYECLCIREAERIVEHEDGRNFGRLKSLAHAHSEEQWIPKCRGVDTGVQFSDNNCESQKSHDVRNYSATDDGELDCPDMTSGPIMRELGEDTASPDAVSTGRNAIVAQKPLATISFMEGSEKVLQKDEVVYTSTSSYTAVSSTPSVATAGIRGLSVSSSAVTSHGMTATSWSKPNCGMTCRYSTGQLDYISETPLVSEIPTLTQNQTGNAGLCSGQIPNFLSEVVTAAAAQAAVAAVNAVHLQSTNKNLEVKLPKLELPTFNGNVLDWPDFWERFSTSVDQQQLPDVAKFNYLKSRLNGSAAQVIDGMVVTGANYGSAVRILKEKFGRTDLADNFGGEDFPCLS